MASRLLMRTTMNPIDYAIHLVMTVFLIFGVYQFYFWCQRHAVVACRRFSAPLDERIGDHHQRDALTQFFVSLRVFGMHSFERLVGTDEDGRSGLRFIENRVEL